MTFARWVFTIGGIWGVLIIAPLFVMENSLAQMTGPFSHPDTYYGFAASTLAWQFGYLMIGRDPVRYRPFMLIGAFSKAVFFGSCWTLVVLGRVQPLVAWAVTPDIVLAILFVVAWWRTRTAG